MKTYTSKFIAAAFVVVTLFTWGCTKPVDVKTQLLQAEKDRVESNIKLYTQVWDDIMNKGEVELFNETNFTTDVLFHSSPENIVGIDSARAYYQNFLTGFSKIKFTINDVFGQGDKIVKHWTFKGNHTGEFFGIPATNKDVTVEGVTLVLMKDGKIAEEQDFFDNLEFMQQLGLIPR